MERFTPVARISLGLVILTCALLLVSDLLGLIPSQADAQLETRIGLCEVLAAQTSSAAEGSNLGGVRAALAVAVRRHEEVLSAGLRRPDGRLLLAVGDHNELWRPPPGEGSTATHVRMPLFRSGKSWATMEVRFARLESEGWLESFWDRPVLRLLALVSIAGFIVYAAYMRRTLRHLDPSAVIPTRVQAAFDVMAEGVLLIDEQERIVLANAAFGERLGRAADTFLGAKVSALGWKTDPLLPSAGLPWIETLRESRTSTGTPMRIRRDDDEELTWVVNGSPVLDGWGNPKGALLTFDDVTELERKTADLKQAMEELEESREEIQSRNLELAHLAKTDPLTGISNRRAFMDEFESRFERDGQDDPVLCCVMADIDHFKRVNDTHGHSAGDEVIRRVASLFASALRDTDRVCRYGGEEFCIVLDGVDIEVAASVGERLRRKIEAPGFTRVPVTASFGISSVASGASRFSELIDHADQALYAAKSSGRNRCVRFDQMPSTGVPDADGDANRDSSDPT